MTRTALLIRVDGSTCEITPKRKKFKLEELQALVHGYIERVRLADGSDMVVNEEGLLLDLPLNCYASSLARTVICGDVVVLRRGLW